ncbi:hypothetical protein STENM223S_03920 [Streptomyces tendae]
MPAPQGRQPAHLGRVASDGAEQHGVGAGLQEGGAAVADQSAHALGEADRLVRCRSQYAASGRCASSKGRPSRSLMSGMRGAWNSIRDRTRAKEARAGSIIGEWKA